MRLMRVGYERVDERVEMRLRGEDVEVREVGGRVERWMGETMRWRGHVR